MYYDIFRYEPELGVGPCSGGADSPVFIRIHRNTNGWNQTSSPNAAAINTMVPTSANCVAAFYAWSGISVSVERPYSTRYYYKVIMSHPGAIFDSKIITGGTGSTTIFTYSMVPIITESNRCLSRSDLYNCDGNINSLWSEGTKTDMVTIPASGISGYAAGTLNYLRLFTADVGHLEQLPVVGNKIYITTASTSGTSSVYTDITRWHYLGWTREIGYVTDVDYSTSKVYVNITGTISSTESAVLVGWFNDFYVQDEPPAYPLDGYKLIVDATFDDNEIYLKDAPYWISNTMYYGSKRYIRYQDINKKIIAFNLSADTTFNVTSTTYNNECMMLYPGSGATKVDGPYLYVGFSGRTHFDEAEIQYVIWKKASGTYTDLGIYPCIGTGRFHFSARTATAYNAYPLFTTSKMPATTNPQGYDFAALVRSKRNNKWTPWAFTRTSASLVPASSSTLYIYCDNVVGDAWEAALNLRVYLTSYSSSPTGLPPSGASVTLYVGEVSDQDFKNNKSGGTYTATATGYSSYTGVTALTQTTKSSASLPVYIKTWWMDSPVLKGTITRSKGAAALSTAITQEITVTSFTKTFTFLIVHTWTTMSTNQTVYYNFYFSGGNSSHWGDKTFSKNLTYSTSALTTSITFDFSYSYYCVGNIRMMGRARSTPSSSYTTGSWNTTHTFAMTTDSITWVGKENGIQWSSRPS